MKNNWRLVLAPVLVLTVASVPFGCQVRHEAAVARPETMPPRDINAVLRAHDKELMAIPGVVGVYVGVLGDQKTSCLKVMAIKRTAELERAVPKSLEGYKVELEETGVIRPMKSD